MAIEVTRLLMLACEVPNVSRVSVRVNEQVAAYLSNRKRREIVKMEELSGATIQVFGSDTVFPEHLEIDCRDREGNLLSFPSFSKS
jgi:ribonuclease E